MPTFMVNSAILRPKTDPMACASNTPEIFKQSGIRNVKLQSCYCCSDEGRVVFIVEAENRDAALSAFDRINVPIASITETQQVKPKITAPAT